jgi:hypothetical protein
MKWAHTFFDNTKNIYMEVAGQKKMVRNVKSTGEKKSLKTLILLKVVKLHKLM